MDISKLLTNAIIDGETVKKISQKVNLDEATTKKVLTVLAPIVVAKVASLISTSSKPETKTTASKSSTKSTTKTATKNTAKKTSTAKSTSGDDLLNTLAGNLLGKVASASNAKKSGTVKKVTR